MSLTWHFRPDDHRLWSMADIKTTSGRTTAPVQPSNVRFIQSSSSSLRALSSLPESELIVLFTPALPPIDGFKPENGAEDPFECFGRAISERHSRVRHVPYVARVGLTDLHLAWMRRAAAIVVVNCDPSLLVDNKGNNSNMSSQIDFGRDVSEALQSMHGASNIPLSCLYISPSAVPQSADYENLLVCSSYSAANMERAASMLIC